MPEIKIKLDPDTHQKLKEYAKEDYRSLTNYITLGLKYLADHPYHRPGIQSAPYTLPNDTAPGIPAPPYKITSEQSIPTEIDGRPIKKIEFAKPQQEKEISPLEEQIKLNKLKDQRYKWIEKTIDRLYPEYRDFPNYNTFLSANQKMYWDKPDEEFIKHIEEVKAEDEYFEAHPELLEDHDDDEDLLKATPHSPEYIKIKNYFTNHCAPYDFEDVTNHARLAKEGNENSIEYIKDYYDINLHDALGSPHSYDFSDDQWTELFKILSE